MLPLLLGTGTGTGLATFTYVFDITLDADVPGDGSIVVVVAETCRSSSGLGLSFPESVSDSGGHLYETGSGRPTIGTEADDDNIHTTLHVESVGRACVTGDLVAGDTMTVTMGPGGFGSAAGFATQAVAAAVFIPAEFSVVNQVFGGMLYNNGDSYGRLGPSATDDELSWVADGFSPVEPVSDCWMYTAMASSPDSIGFAPFVGSVIAEVSAPLAGDAQAVSLAVAVYQAAALSAIDPGGVFADHASILVGNYQFNGPIVTPPAPGFHAWQRF